MTPSTVDRPAADLGESFPSASVTWSRMVSADFRWNCALLWRSSASATGIACLLQLIDQFERLARGKLVGADLVEHGIKRINFRLPRRGCRRKQRKIV